MPPRSSPAQQNFATSDTDNSHNRLNIALTQYLPSMDGAHRRLVNLEDTAYRCLSREEAKRILQEADALSSDLQASRDIKLQPVPLHRPGQAA